ncbi:MAG: hypothetical protein NC203_09570 [Firmicutes bacterium]|nr:hypothetical protein [Bacillota bacterium]
MKKLLFFGKCLLSLAVIAAVVLGCCFYAGEKERVTLTVSGGICTKQWQDDAVQSGDRRSAPKTRLKTDPAVISDFDCLLIIKS